MINSQTCTKTPRIEVVDALRGFAVLAIVLIHNIEHFNLYIFPEGESAFLDSLNKYVWDTLFFLFGGKAYAIFALLFGFSFHIQLKNRERQGKSFCGRFLWRLLLLAGFGLFHALFYSGDILVLYAIVGIVLIPVRNVSNRQVLLIAILLMLQPLELGKFFYALCTPDYVFQPQSDYFWIKTQEGLKSPSFIALVQSNLCNGEWYSLSWAWNNGRFFQTASLFMLGMLIARENLFVYSERTIAYWKKVLIAGIISFIPLYLTTIILSESGLSPELLVPLKVTLSSWANVAFMFILVSLFILLWYRSNLKKTFSYLIPYGKMSLTNYIGQSIMGSFIYFGYGLALYPYLGITYSLLTGLLLFAIQLAFCRWWLASHKQGPLETIWHKATWIKSR